LVDWEGILPVREQRVIEAMGSEKVSVDKTEKTKPLIESGFEYLTAEYGDGGKLFRKKKALYLGPVENSKGP